MNGPVIEGKKIVDGKNMGQGECRFCHQLYSFEIVGDPTSNEAVRILNRRAMEVCDCEEAKVWRVREARREKALENIDKMFRRDFPETADILAVSVDAIMYGRIDKINLDTGYGVKAKMRLDKDGNVVVERSQSSSKILKS